MRLTRSSLVSLRLLRCSAAAFGILTAPAMADPRTSGPLPQAPEGLHVRELARFGPDDQEPVRIAAQPGTGRLFVLGGGGDVTAIDPKIRRDAPRPGGEGLHRPARGSDPEHPAPGRRQGGQLRRSPCGRPSAWGSPSTARGGCT